MPGPVFLEMPLDLLMNMARRRRPPRDRAARRAAARRAAIRALIAQRAPSCSRAPSGRCSSSAASSAGRRAARRVAAFADALRGAVLPERHGARRAARTSIPRCMTRSRTVRARPGRRGFVFGTPFDFRVDYGRTATWNPDAKIVQIDLDGAELGRNREVDVAIHGDSGLVLEQLARERRADEARLSELARAGARRRGQAAREDARARSHSNEIPPNPLRVCAELGKRLGPNDIVIGDGGDFVATAAYVLKIEWPQLWMDPGPLGTLGVGPGYAMAAKLARPDANVVLVYGDGIFGLHAPRVRGDGAPEHPGRRRHRQRRRLDADPPRPGRDLRRDARGRDGARLHALRRRWSRPVGGFGAWVERSRTSSARRSTRPSRAASPRAST